MSGAFFICISLHVKCKSKFNSTLILYLSLDALLHNNKYLSNINKKLLTFKKSYAILWKRQNETAFLVHLIRAKFMRRTLCMKDKLTLFTKYLLDFMFYSGIFVILTLPFSIRFYGKYNTYFRDNYYSLLVVFFLSGIFAVLIIYELRKMFRSVLNDDCFIRENVTSLEKMSTYSFFISVIMACRLFIYITPAVLIIILVFVIAGLFSKVLAQVFDKAVNYKLENDLTI